MAASEKDKPTVGAPFALTFISEEEAEARNDIKKAKQVLEETLRLQRDRPKHLDGQDFDKDAEVAEEQLRAAVKRYEVWAKYLNLYHKGVSPEQRSSSENMTREQVRNFIFLLAIHNRSAYQQFITSFADKVLSCRTSEDVYALVVKQFDECTRNAYLTAKHEGQMDEWAVEAFEDSLGIVNSQK